MSCSASPATAAIIGKAFEEFEVIDVKPCARFGGGRETVTFQRVPKRPGKGRAE